MKRKYLAIGIILLFVGVTFAQSISENQLVFAKNNKNSDMSTEKTTLSCQYFTLSGVIESKKEVTVQDALHLSQLMNGSDNEAIISELDHLGLLPETVSREQATELLNGVYAQKELQRQFQRSQRLLYLGQSSESEWMKNSFCSVNGYGSNYYFMTPTSLVLKFIFVELYALFVSLPAGLLGILLAAIFNDVSIFYFFLFLFCYPQLALQEVLLDNGWSIIPLKFSPIVVAELYDWDGTDFPILNTSGIRGNWSIGNYTGIGIHMTGFFGIWLSRFPGTGDGPSAQVKGYCLNINAKGLNDWYWKGWEDWPWSSNVK